MNLNFNPDVEAPPQPRDHLRAAARSSENTPGLPEALAAIEVLRAKVAALEGPSKPSPVNANPTKTAQVAQGHAELCEIAELEARAHRWSDDNSGREMPVADPAAPVALPTGAIARDPTGLARAADGTIVWPDADLRPYEVRQAEATARHRADEKAELDKMREGLERGQIRLGGLVRNERDFGSVVTEARPVTERTPARSLIRPHQEEIDAGQDPNAVTDEWAEIMKLRRRPDPVVPPAIVAEVVQPVDGATESPDRPIPEPEIERPMSVLDQLRARQGA